MTFPLARARGAAALRDRAPVEVDRDGEVVVEARSPFLVSPPATGSLADLPYRNAAEAPDAPVMARKAGRGWRDVTAAAFAAEVTATAKGLVAAGVRPGDRIALMARSCYDWTLLDFAAWAAGAAVVPLYPTASIAQATWIVAEAGVVAAVAEDADCARVLTAALAAAGRDLPVWRLDEGAIGTLVSRGTDVPDVEIARRRAALGPDSEATLIYTSGTTGTPKGVRLTHGNFVAAAVNCVELLKPVFDAVSDEPASTLLFLPLAHVLGRAIEVACVHARIRIGHSPSIKPAELRPDLASFGATFLVGVPYLFEKIYDLGTVEAQDMRAGHVFARAARIATRYGRAALDQLAGDGPPPPWRLRAAHRLYDVLVYRKVRKALGGKVRYAISGGSSLSPDLLLFFAGAGILIYEGYGLTETTGPSTVNPPLRPRPGTVGPPVPGSAVRIAADGEVLVRGCQVGPEVSHEVGHELGGDGWFATGDLGRLDPDGYLTITGRKKEILVTSGGKNVSPGPLEDRLRAHPLVSQCLVVGDGRPYVAALVTLDTEAVEQHARHLPDPPPDTAVPVDVSAATPVPPAVLAQVAEAAAEANRSVSRAESVRRVRVVAGDFTVENDLLTPSLKVKRAAILRAYAADVEALYDHV
ncbi:MAG: AMP-dependent synthetase/ligase [Mycobacteriales bacterium]